MRRLILIALNQIAVVLIGLSASMLVSHIVPKDVLAPYVLFVSLTQVGLLLTHSGLINHTLRYWRREANRSATYARFLWAMSWRNVIILASLLFLSVVVITARTRDGLWLIVYPSLLLSNLGVLWFAMANLALNVSHRHGTILLLGIAANGSRSFFPIGLAALGGATLLTLSLGFGLHAVCVLVCLGMIFGRTSKSPPPEAGLREKWLRELRDFGRPFIWMGVGSWLLQFVDRWTVAFLFDTQRLADFGYASMVASPVAGIVGTGLLQLVFPGILKRADAAKTAEDWRQLARRCDQCTLCFLGLTLLGLAVLWWGFPYLLGSLIADRYASSAALLWPAGLVAASMQINQFQYLLLQGQHNSVGMVRVMIVTACIKTAGSILAGWISWTALVLWMSASPLIVGWIGRMLVRRIALNEKLPRDPAWNEGKSI